MRYFGTDGIRGKADALLRDGLPYLLGAALDGGGKVVVARDVRVHSREIENMLVSGLLSGDGEVCLAGVLPTPALAYIMKEEGARYGVMITASHNPPEYNGLKVFFKGGKLSPSQEEALDGRIAALIAEREAAGDSRTTAFVASREAVCDCLKKPNHRVRVLRDAEERYKRHVAAQFPRFDGEKVLLDCAKGCMAQLAKSVFEALGANVRALNDARDGKCVNVNCGSTHPTALLSALKEGEIGFAFDGDGDRVVAAIHSGAVRDGGDGDRVVAAINDTSRGDDGENSISGAKLVDGDGILLAVASLYQAQGKLKKKLVVGTSLTNGMLQKELTKRNIALLRADVGDKNVLAAMQENGAVLGGEKSGHVLILDRADTGDGLMTALTLLEAKRTLGALPAYLPYKAAQFDLPSPSPRQEVSSPAFAKKEAEAKALMADRGRIVVRPSGTESCVRVYLEGDSTNIDAVFDSVKKIFFDNKNDV